MILTILMPTLNRPEFVVRLIAYYEIMDVNYKFIIGDASNQRNSLERIFFNKFPNTHNFEKDWENRHVEIINCEGMSVSDTMYKINQLIKTPYSTILPDDDILFPGGIESCIAFLENNKDYVSCHGNAGIFDLHGSGPYGKIRDLGDYNLKAVENNTSKDRIRHLMANYSGLLFGIHRTSAWIQMWNKSKGIESYSLADELIPNYMSAQLGKSKHLDVPYLLRQHHPARINHNPLGRKMTQIHIPILSQIKKALLNRSRIMSLPKLRKMNEFKEFELLLRRDRDE